MFFARALFVPLGISPAQERLSRRVANIVRDVAKRPIHRSSGQARDEICKPAGQSRRIDSQAHILAQGAAPLFLVFFLPLQEIEHAGSLLNGNIHNFVDQDTTQAVGRPAFIKAGHVTLHDVFDQKAIKNAYDLRPELQIVHLQRAVVQHPLDDLVIEGAEPLAGK